MHVPRECFLVRHLDHLNLERIAVVSFDDDVPQDEATAVICQEREFVVFERSKVVTST